MYWLHKESASLKKRSHIIIVEVNMNILLSLSDTPAFTYLSQTSIYREKS